jgi:hypothetical protein
VRSLAWRGALALEHRSGAWRGERLPRAIHVVSPFCDLSVSEQWWDFSESCEAWLNRIYATQLAG